MNQLIEIITTSDDAIRNRSLDAVCRGLSLDELQRECQSLDRFRRQSDNLYFRVRALFFLSAIHRYHIPERLAPDNTGLIPFVAYQRLLQRRFNEAIDLLLDRQTAVGANDGLSSALSRAYTELGFQTLADQVRRSVRTVRGNQWMFRIGHPQDHPLRLRRELLQRPASDAPYPILRETTPVRMDFSHSAWSDIFFLGMDFPAGARVLNASVDLGVRGRDAEPRPPIETYLRVIDQPVLRLVSVDLNASCDIQTIHEVFDLARDYLGLLKAAVIAAGIVPPGMEGCEERIATVLERLIGPGLGLELVSKVNDIPKGSRLAVSTNLLGSLISICMRATRQVNCVEGPLTEADRRIVAARAILGEWLGGSGGGWQDSGGIWPGIKLISGADAADGDPEFGVSRGRLLPNHEILGPEQVSPQTRQQLQDSLILVHGGMAQNVGPILEMVTEKYLLRSEDEWKARHDAMEVLEEVGQQLRAGDVRAIGNLTTRNFEGPLQAIIPWATNLFTDTLIERCREEFDTKFWGFWMLGGMSGGGMGFIFAPDCKAEAQDWLGRAMSETKQQLQTALPFAMEPVVYDFAINDQGTCAELSVGQSAWMPDAYYGLMAPRWLRSDTQRISPSVQRELEHVSERCLGDPDGNDSVRRILSGLLPQVASATRQLDDLGDLLKQFGFDRTQHEQIREDLREARIGLSQNRLSPSTTIEDARSDDVLDCRRSVDQRYVDIGSEALRAGEVAVVTLAAGAGSRWTEGAGVVKALHPFCRLAGRHRNFLEVHLAKSRKAARQWQCRHPHVFSTGYLTDEPIRSHLTANDYGYKGDLHISTGRSVGLRMVPTARELRFAWEEMPQQLLDEQQEKVRSSLRQALIDWARGMGEGSDYTDNMPLQCLHPVGHWYEFPNMLRNGILLELLRKYPRLKWLMLHNVDTLGASLDPGLLGRHIAEGACLSIEVITRRLEDRGGGLARVNGQLRLLEGLAMPSEEAEFELSFYNSMTTWIDIDQLLALFELARDDLPNRSRVDEAVRRLARRVPTYITLKDVKKRWGHGQEDVFPVVQFEKLWGDMTALPDADCRFFVTPLQRGQQLKEQAQLDGWLRDGSAEYVNSLCQWD